MPARQTIDATVLSSLKRPSADHATWADQAMLAEKLEGSRQAKVPGPSATQGRSCSGKGAHAERSQLAQGLAPWKPHCGIEVV